MPEDNFLLLFLLVRAQGANSGPKVYKQVLLPADLNLSSKLQHCYWHFGKWYLWGKYFSICLWYACMCICMYIRRCACMCLWKQKWMVAVFLRQGLS